MSGNDQSIVDLIRNTIQDAQELVRGEIALAKAELRGEVTRLRAGAIAFVAAAVTALFGLGFLLTAAAWAIPAVLGWPAWTGFALVGGMVTLTAVVLALIGRSRLAGGRRLQLTVDTMKENMQWIRARTS